MRNIKELEDTTPDSNITMYVNYLSPYPTPPKELEDTIPTGWVVG